MDAEYYKSKRDHDLSRREQRWSMNSQRLEEIVAELMKPISDVRRSFDTDLCALLEEYLTEAGLHALEEGEEGTAAAGAPNFAELALLLQQSASIYGRKVDFLYQHVLNVSDSLHNSTQEMAHASAPEEEEARAGATPLQRRKRKASGSAEFGDIALAPCAGAAREAGAPRPPPTLPRMYLELEPRQLGDADAPLADYAGEPIGLLADFHVAWRLSGGLLLDELQAAERPRRPPLLQLRAALEAAAPPLPSPPPPPASPPPTPPPPPDPAPLGCSTPLPAAGAKLRKRRNPARPEEAFEGSCKFRIDRQIKKKLSEMSEFSIPDEWIRSVVTKRSLQIVDLRRQRHEPKSPSELDFRGFDASAAEDIGGFCGWSESEAAAAAAAAALARSAKAAAGDDSDDDGFFEQSSLGDSDASRREESPRPALAERSAAEWAEWRAGVLARAHRADAAGLDVRALAGRVLRRLPAAPANAPAPAPAPALPFPALLRAEAEGAGDVSRLLLAALLLANAGNVEIVPGPALSVDSCSLRLLSADERVCVADRFPR